MKILVRSLFAPTVLLLLGVGSSQALGQNFTSAFAGDFEPIQVAEQNLFGVAQFAFSPDGSRLYTARFEGSLESFAYDRDASGEAILTDRRTVLPRGRSGSLGVALHQSDTLGTVLYTSVAVPFTAGPGAQLSRNESQTIRRTNDLNGNGIFGESSAGEFTQDIITGLQVNQNHQTNQLLIRGDSLFFNTGTRTCSGGDGGCETELIRPSNPDAFFADPAQENEVGEYSYTGAVNFIADVNQIADTTTSNVAGMGVTGEAIDTNGNGVANNIDSLTGALSDRGPGQFRVFSNGLRNPFGITSDDAGNLLVSVNEEQFRQRNPGQNDPDDTIFETSQFANHGFDSFNGLLDNVLSDPVTSFDDGDNTNGIANPIPVEGNFRTSAATADARADGFFGNIDGPLALLGDGVNDGVSAVGLATFASNTVDEDFRDDILVIRRDRRDILHVDRATGDTTPFLNGIGQSLDLIRDPVNGDFLVATGNGRILRIRSLTGVPDMIDGRFAGVDFDNGGDEPSSVGPAPANFYVLEGLADSGNDGGNDVTINSLGPQAVGNTMVSVEFSVQSPTGRIAEQSGDIASQGAMIADLGPLTGSGIDNTVFDDGFFTNGQINLTFTGLSLDPNIQYNVYVLGNSTGGGNALGVAVDDGSGTVLTDTGTFTSGDPLTPLTVGPVSATGGSLSVRVTGDDNVEMTLGDDITTGDFFGISSVVIEAVEVGSSPSCDVNMDGAVNFSDISPFIAALASPVFLPSADCNGDGEVNFSDISPFIAALAAGP